MAAEKGEETVAAKWETAVEAADEEKGVTAAKKGTKAADEERGAPAVRKGETGGMAGDEENGATEEGKGATAVEKGKKVGSGASGDEGKGATAEGKGKLSEDEVLKLSEEVEWKWKIAASADGEEEPKPRREERRRWRSTRSDPPAAAAAADKEDDGVTAAAKEVAGEKPVFFFGAAAAGKKNPVSSEAKLLEETVGKLSEEAEWKWKIATPGGEEVPKPRRERRRGRSKRREPAAAAADKGEATAVAKEVAGEKKFFFFSAGAGTAGKMINLVSKEGKPFQMSEAAARLSAVLADMIDHGCAGGNIPVPNVDARSLATVIKYCDKHAAAAKPNSGSHYGAADGAGSSSSVNTAASQKTLAEWDRKLVDDLTLDALYDLIVAANFLDIKELLEATCQKVADMMKGKTPAEIRSIFHIANDFTAEEEAEIRKETPWAFED